jgi:PPM family protein phosphatase
MQAAQLEKGDARSFLDVDMIEPEAFRLAGGTAAVLSLRRPAKDGPNEDAAAVIAVGDDAAVLVVADGCGGMAGGDQAARLAIECMRQSIADAMEVGDSLRSAILDGVEHANRQILDLRNGAGATLAVVQIEGNHARPYHVGDAQILLVGGRGKVKLFTMAHSPVGYAYEAGILDEREALAHEDRHLVSNVLGAAEMHVEVGSSRMMATRDGLLIASDGVLDNLLLEEAVDALRTGTASRAAVRLASLARQRMVEPDGMAPSKPDDLTLIVFSRR